MNNNDTHDKKKTSVMMVKKMKNMATNNTKINNKKDINKINMKMDAKGRRRRTKEYAEEEDAQYENEEENNENEDEDK